MAGCFGGISDAITETECRHAKSAVKPSGALQSRHRVPRHRETVDLLCRMALHRMKKLDSASEYMLITIFVWN